MMKPVGGVAGLVLVGPFSALGLSVPAVKTQRGNIAFDQVRLTDRQGTGSLFQMYNPVIAGVPGDGVVFDANFNLIDAGGAPIVLVPAPVHYNSAGSPGQGAYDGSGNWYWCYTTNRWARMGPGGYSNSF